ncbi:MAG: PstC family ABC transporter permease, partial [bacterium]
MSSSTLAITLAVVALIAYFTGRRRAFVVSGGKLRKLHSLPSYYGLYAVIWCVVPALFLVVLWLSMESSVITSMVVEELPVELRQQDEDGLRLTVNDIHNLASGGITAADPTPAIQTAADRYNELGRLSRIFLIGISVAMSAVFGWLAFTRINPQQRARNSVEAMIRLMLMVCAGIAILTTVGIVLSVLFESLRFFEKVPFFSFVFGLEWSPQMSIRADQVGSSGAFGAIPLFAGTLLISFIAMLVAAPVGLMAALYLSEYASSKVRAVSKPLLEVLAGIPTVVYGFFAALTVAPFFRDYGGMIGLEISSESALAAGVVMGIMIIPFVSSLSDDVINAVP